jgi:hypothetical protein
MKFFFTSFLLSLSLFVNAQTYQMNGTTNGQTINFTCPIADARFTDSGLGNTNYSDNLDVSITFCAPAGKLLRFNFGGNTCNRANDKIHFLDTLFMYNGSSTSAPLLYAVTGGATDSSLPYFRSSSTFEFVSSSECITFRFKSNATINENGWDACITCVDPVSCNGNEPMSDLFGGAPFICNLNGYCGTTSGDFGADIPVNLKPTGSSTNCSTLPLPNFAGAIENNSWVKFIADSTSAIFDFNVPLGGGCTNGIQTAIFSYDGTSLTRLSDCLLSDGSQNGNFSLSASGLTVGNTYYIMTDGNAGDVCNYTINARAGVATLDAGLDREVCLGQSTTLSASGPSGATYTWNSIDGVISNQIGQNITVTPDVATTYIVRVSGGGVCENQLDTVEVAVCTLLPIKLIAFEAQFRDYNVYLNWETASEIDNDFFTIERSENGLTWEAIQKIKGAGDSNTLLSYTFIDKEPYQGLSYYRLKQTDYNGSFEYSQVVSINANLSPTEDLRIYPNPTTNTITITGTESELSEFKIYNMVGQEITGLVIISKQKNRLSIDLSKLSKGIYYVKTKTIAGKIYKE